MSQRLTKKQRRQRALRLRRRAALAVLALAIAAGLVAWRVWPGASALPLGAGAVVLALEAALLARRRPMPGAVYALVAALCVFLLGAGWPLRGYVASDMGILPREALVTTLKVTDAWPEDMSRYTGLKALDLRNSTVDDFTPALSVRSLAQMDVRGNTHFTLSDFRQFAEALPRCRVKWSIPIGGNLYDSDVETIDVTDLGLTADALEALRADYPDKQFVLRAVRVLGREIDPDAEAVDLQGVENLDTRAVLDALQLIPNARTVDLRGTPLSAQAIDSLCAARPDVRFICDCAVPYGSMTTEDAAVTLPGGDYTLLEAYMAFMDHMPNLEYLDARAIAMNEGEIQTLQADPRSSRVIYPFTLYNQQVNALTESLNLDGVKLTRDEVETVLQRLPRLKTLSLCNCGLSDQDMGALFDAHPEVKLIWWISFGKYKLRTDATAFTTNLYASNKYHYNEQTFEPLRYCTDLMMLDLGHCDITTLEGFRGLTKLRVLILADNKIKDISPLQGMEDLEYVELFLNKIKDFSPLANKAHLVDLNIYYCPIADITPLTTCPGLQRLWVGQCGLSSGDLSRLHEALPSCKINAQGSSSTGRGWREHAHYRVLKEMYKTGEYIPFE